jgi:hypothetical protein
MTLNTEAEKEQSKTSTNTEINKEPEKVLCPHCQRTATNGIKCQGICVADSDY